MGKDSRQLTAGSRQKKEGKRQRADDFGLRISDFGLGILKNNMGYGERQRAADSGQRAEKRRQRTEGVWLILELGNWKISQTDVFLPLTATVYSWLLVSFITDLSIIQTEQMKE